MKYYKLLTQQMTSHQGTKWEIGIPIAITKEGNKMRTDQVLHCYNHPLLAVIFNPIHANIKNPKLFEISVDSIVATDGLKFASKSQTLIQELELPEISTEQKIHFAIKVAKLVYKDEKWNFWADSYLSGDDVSKKSAASDAAYADANAAANAAFAAAYAAANAAANAAFAAAYAANAAFAAANAADAAASAVRNADKNEFNQKMIDIIEEILDKQQS